SVAFRADSDLLATGGEGKIPSQTEEGNIIRLYQRTRGVTPEQDEWGLVKTLTGHKSWIRSVAFSPDGQMLASGGEDQIVRLWDVSNPSQAHLLKELSPEHYDKIRRVVFSPDGKTL